MRCYHGDGGGSCWFLHIVTSGLGSGAASGLSGTAAPLCQRRVVDLSEPQPDDGGMMTGTGPEPEGTHGFEKLDEKWTVSYKQSDTDPTQRHNLEVFILAWHTLTLKNGQFRFSHELLALAFFFFFKRCRLSDSFHLRSNIKDPLYKQSLSSSYCLHHSVIP